MYRHMTLSVCIYIMSLFHAFMAISRAFKSRRRSFCSDSEMTCSRQRWSPEAVEKKTMGIISPTMWGPPVINCFISPINYSYKYHKSAYYGLVRDVYQ